MATKTSLCALALLSLFLSRQKLVVVSGRRAHKTRLSFSRFVSVVSSLCRRRLCLLDCKTDWMRFVMWRPVLCFFFSFFSFVWGRFFSVFLLIQMRKTWWHLESWNDFGKERQKERKKERERHFEKKKGRNFLSLSLSREKKHLLHVRPIKRSRFFVFFSEDLRDDFDDI